MSTPSGPNPGRSFFDQLPAHARTLIENSAASLGDGQMIPPAPVEAVGGIGAVEPGISTDHIHAVLQRRGYQPIGTYTEPFRPGPHPVPHPAVFISCTDKPDNDPLIGLAAGLRARGWTVKELPTGHFPMLSTPTKLTELILER